MVGSAKNLPSVDQVPKSRAVVLAPNCCTVEALTRRLRRGWILLLPVWLAPCGGAGKAADPGDGPPDGPVVEAGRVLLDNQSPYEVEAAYLNEVDADLPRVVRTRVEAGGRKDVSGAVLPAGLEVEFDLVLLVPPERGFRVRRKAQVQVDGDVLVRLRLAADTDAFNVEIEVGAAD